MVNTPFQLVNRRFSGHGLMGTKNDNSSSNGIFRGCVQQESVLWCLVGVYVIQKSCSSLLESQMEKGNFDGKSSLLRHHRVNTF
jgi:hypothetical protein